MTRNASGSRRVSKTGPVARKFMKPSMIGSDVRAGHGANVQSSQATKVPRTVVRKHKANDVCDYIKESEDAQDKVGADVDEANIDEANISEANVDEADSHKS